MEAKDFTLSCDPFRRVGISRGRQFFSAVGVLFLIVTAVGLFSSSVTAQNSVNYTTSIGDTPFSTTLPVELGSLDLSNGNLHQMIPLGIWPQRGNHAFTAALVYDSRIWAAANVGGTNTWQPTNVPNSQGGWRFIATPVIGGTTSFEEQVYNCDGTIADPPYNRNSVVKYFNFQWTDPYGTVRMFPITTIQDRTNCIGDTPTGSAFAIDSSGFKMSVSNYTSTINIYAPDGSQVFPSFEDTNGNTFGQDSTGNVIDTLGRKPVVITTDCNGNSNQTCYDVLNSQGSTSRYIATTESITVNTAFGVSGVTEYSGSITVISSLQLPDLTTYQFSYDNGPSNTYGELINVKLPAGGQIAYSYTTYTDPLGNVNRWTTGRTAGGGIWAYAPQGSFPCPSSTSFVVCQLTSVTKPSNDATQYLFGLNNGAWLVELTTLTGTINAVEISDAVTNWNISNSCPISGCTGAAYVQNTSTTTTFPIPNSSISKTVQYTYGSLFNQDVTEIQEWNFWTTQNQNPDRITTITYNAFNEPLVTTVTNGTQTATYSQTKITYDNYGSGGPTSVTGVVQHDDTNYGVSNTNRGNPTSVQQLVSGTSYLTTQRLTYDTTGQVLTALDAAGNTTSYSYSDNYVTDNGNTIVPPSSYGPPSPTNAFVTKVTQPLVGSTYIAYYFGTGQLASTTDPNGAASYAHFYDPFSRPTSTLGPPVPLAGQQQAVSPWSLANYTSPTEVDSFTGITLPPFSSTCSTPSSCRHDENVYDSLERATFSYLVNDPDGEDTSQIVFDTNSRVSSAYAPYRSTPTASDAFAFDGADRVTMVSRLDGTSTRTTYGSAISGLGTGSGANTSQSCSTSIYGYGYPVYILDAAGRKRETWTDGFGRMIETDEPNSSGNLIVNTCYKYDLNNNLLEVDQGSQTRLYTYDLMSRLLSVLTPEMKYKIFQGKANFTYASDANVCSSDPRAVCTRTDPRGTRTTYSIDALWRLTGITYSDSTRAVAYCYDGNNSRCGTTLSASYGVGRLTAMSDGSGNRAMSYRADGLVITDQRTINGVTKTMSYSYNLDGSMASVTYPSGRTINYIVSNAQRQMSASDASTGTQYASGAVYFPTGAVTSVIYGQVSGGFAGIKEVRSYNNRLQITGILTASSNANALNLAYCYGAYSFSSGCSSPSTNNDGTVSGITNGNYSGESLSFAYDNLNRVTSAATQATTGNDCWGQSFSPDAVGNLTTVNSTQSGCPALALSVSTDGSNHLTTGTKPNFVYDSAGNMTNDLVNAYSYDAENHIISGAGVNYIYDGNGWRVEKSSGMLYWRATSGDVLAESDLSGNTISEYIYFAGRKVARVDGSGNVFYFHSDSLGSFKTITNANGSLCYDATFTPYGQEILNPAVAETCESNYKFTGYEYDGETGLYYAIGRHYSPRLGRFMSTDPVGGGSGSPQSWDAYAYVRNNPTNLTDPSGLFLPVLPGSGYPNPDPGYGPSPSMCELYPFMCDPGYTQPPSGPGGGAAGAAAGASAKAICNLTIFVQNNPGTGLLRSDIDAAEGRIASLFGTAGVSVTFLSSGDQSSAQYTYTLTYMNNTNPAIHQDELGRALAYLGSPSFVWANHVVSSVNAVHGTHTNQTNVLGNVGAHELVHAITGIQDLALGQGSQYDLMNLDNNPAGLSNYMHNDVGLTTPEKEALYNRCLHPEIQ